MMSSTVARIMRCAVVDSRLKGISGMSSTAVQLMSSPNRPKNSGDKGPEKNYAKKMLKKANKSEDTESTARRTFMKALKAVESGETASQDTQAQENEL